MLEIKEIENGFEYIFRDKASVYLRFRPTFLIVENHRFPSLVFNFYDMDGVLETILSMLLCCNEDELQIIKLDAIKSKTNLENEILELEDHLSNCIPTYINLIVDYDVLRVHKKSFNYISLNHSDECDYTIPLPSAIYYDFFYDNKYIISDMCKFDACIIAFNELSLIFEPRRETDFDVPLYEFLSEASNYEAYEKNKKIESYKKFMTLDLIITHQKSLYKELILQATEDWMSLYSYNGKKYKSLNKTLSNLPSGLRVIDIKLLRNIRLIKPLTNRMEFLITIHGYLSHHKTVFIHAESKRIREALILYSNHVNQEFCDSSSFFEQFIQFLIYYPITLYGSIEDLTKRAIKLHVEQNVQADDDWLKLYDPNQKTGLPKYKLSQNKNVRFLKTVGDIEDESNNMGHCISLYISNAVMSLSFIYHIDYQYQSATAVLNQQGKLLEIRGPLNSNNKAVKYGEEFFRSAQEEPLSKSIIARYEAIELEANNDQISLF